MHSQLDISKMMMIWVATAAVLRWYSDDRVLIAVRCLLLRSTMGRCVRHVRSPWLKRHGWPASCSALCCARLPWGGSPWLCSRHAVASESEWRQSRGCAPSPLRGGRSESRGSGGPIFVHHPCGGRGPAGVRGSTFHWLFSVEAVHPSAAQRRSGRRGRLTREKPTKSRPQDPGRTPAAAGVVYKNRAPRFPGLRCSSDYRQVSTEHSKVTEETWADHLDELALNVFTDSGLAWIQQRCHVM